MCESAQGDGGQGEEKLAEGGNSNKLTVGTTNGSSGDFDD